MYNVLCAIALICNIQLGYFSQNRFEWVGDGRSDSSISCACVNFFYQYYYNFIFLRKPFAHVYFHLGGVFRYGKKCIGELVNFRTFNSHNG